VDCPSEDTLVAIAEGRLGPNTTSTYNHIESCESCRVLFNEVARSFGRDGDDAQAGERVGRYQLRQLIGKGGMGRVYAAHDPELDRDVAIKLLRSDIDSATAELRARLLREAQTMARLSHPNVIAVYDVGIHGKQVFIAMELVEGQTLRRWLDEGEQPWRDILRVLLLAGRGLLAAHEVGIVHRDFKPDNVMIARNGSVRVLDFGLARAVVNELGPGAGATPTAFNQSLTVGIGLVGTPAYMAPEQLASEPIDARTDQFSFCVSLYQALTGKRPFVGATVEALLLAIRNGERDAEREAQIPSWLRPVIARGLSAVPDERFPSMAELLAALERDPAGKRRRWLIGTAGVVACASVAAFGYQQARRQASQVCQGAEAQLAGVWDAALKDRVRAAFGATHLAYAQDAFSGTARALDDYARRWQSMHVETCRATRVLGEQSEELLDLRMSCLAERRDELKALVDLFASADARTVEKAAQAAYALADVDQCANIAALKAPIPPPRDRKARAEVEKLRTRLAPARAFYYTGKYAEALRVMEPIVADARALAYAPLLADALLLQGEVEQRSDDGRGSERSLRAALVAAADGHHERAEYEAAWRLAFTVGYLLHRYDEGRFWGELALAVLHRLGGDNDKDIGDVTNALESIAFEEGNMNDALTLSERALEAMERGRGSPPRVAMLLHNRAVLLANLGRNDEALAAALRGKEICERTLGPRHPDTAMMIKMTGLALRELKRYDEALPFLQSALGINEEFFGPMHARTAMAYDALGSLEKQLGDYDAALANSRHAIAIYEKLGSKARLTMAPYLNVGEVELERGHPAAAVAPLERALAIEESAGGGPPADRAEVKLALARALWDAHGDRRRAVTLAREAHALYSGEAGSKEELARVDAWLTAHAR
jgi:tetratricopeptide (TPR) repeat protein